MPARLARRLDDLLGPSAVALPLFAEQRLQTSEPFSAARFVLARGCGKNGGRAFLCSSSLGIPRSGKFEERPSGSNSFHFAISAEMALESSGSAARMTGRRLTL